MARQVAVSSCLIIADSEICAWTQGLSVSSPVGSKILRFTLASTPGWRLIYQLDLVHGHKTLSHRLKSGLNRCVVLTDLTLGQSNVWPCRPRTLLRPIAHPYQLLPLSGHLTYPEQLGTIHFGSGDPKFGYLHIFRGPESPYFVRISYRPWIVYIIRGSWFEPGISFYPNIQSHYSSKHTRKWCSSTGGFSLFPLYMSYLNSHGPCYVATW